MEAKRGHSEMKFLAGWGPGGKGGGGSYILVTKQVFQNKV